MYFLNEISAVRTANQVFQILLTCSFNFFSDSISILVSRVHNRALNLSTSWLTLAGVIQNICINIHYIQCITYQCNTMYRHGRISMRGYWGWGPCPHPPPRKIQLSFGPCSGSAHVPGIFKLLIWKIRNFP